MNDVVADTAKWEQSAAHARDTHPAVDAFVKNAGLGFAIPYLHNGQLHDYMPDFIVRLRSDPPCLLILETKGFDPTAEVKAAAAQRWVGLKGALYCCATVMGFNRKCRAAADMWRSFV